MTSSLDFGPRLCARPTAPLRSALLAAVGPSIERARPLAGEPNAVRSRAQMQQEILGKTLAYFGCEVATIAGPADDPLGSALADAGVVFENGVAILRPTDMGRRAATRYLEAALEEREIPVAGEIVPPALVDGSDVLLVGKTAFVGCGSRGNALGRRAFAQIARSQGFRVVELALPPGAPPLRAMAGAVSEERVVISERIDRSAFEGFEAIVLERQSELGAGVLNLGDDHVLADMRFPPAVNALRKHGVLVEAIDLYDFAKIGITPSMLVLDLKRC